MKSGISKAKIKRESGIPEGTIRGWMTEEGPTMLTNKWDCREKKAGLGSLWTSISASTYGSYKNEVKAYQCLDVY